MGNCHLGMNRDEWGLIRINRARARPGPVPVPVPVPVVQGPISYFLNWALGHQATIQGGDLGTGPKNGPENHHLKLSEWMRWSLETICIHFHSLVDQRPGAGPGPTGSHQITIIPINPQGSSLVTFADSTHSTRTFSPIQNQVDFQGFWAFSAPIGSRTNRLG